MNLKQLFSKDGFTNILRGIKGSKDITSNPQYNLSKILTTRRNELQHLYSGNWLGKKIVNIPINDAFKEGITNTCNDAEKLEIFEKALVGFKIDKHLKQAGKWNRVFGGSAIIIVSDDDAMDQPLEVLNMKKGDLRNFVVVGANDIYSTNLNRNQLDPNYLEPEYYNLTRTSSRIHYSRVIKFDGEETTNDYKEFLQGFGLSVFESLYTSIMNAEISPDLMVNLIAQSNQDVYKIKELNEAVASNQDDLVTKRLETAQKMKSIMNAIVLDAEDDYANVSKSFAGLKEVNREFFQIVSGASDIPLTRLLGVQEAGLGSDGEGSLKNYYDFIRAVQSDYTNPINKIYSILQMHLFGELIDLKFEFNELFQLTATEKANMNKVKADTDTVHLNNGAITRIDIMERLVQDKEYPSITPERLEEEKKLEEEMAFDPIGE